MTHRIIGKSIYLTPVDYHTGVLLQQKSSDQNSEWPPFALRAYLPIYLESLEKREAKLGYGPWIIKHIKEDLFLGTISVKGMPTEASEVEVGYHILSPYRNHGYATEALLLLCKWLFNHKIDSIVAYCHKENRASKMVLIKSGFTKFNEEEEVVSFKKKRKI